MAETAALVIAILGAESTGKTTLAAGLAAALTARGIARVTWVPEVLRDWCQQNGRTPRREEQRAILEAQDKRIAEAAAGHAVVVCDTTALMTAVYSRVIFGDRSLEAGAVQSHRAVSLSLLTALDLPWVADGHQRDGPHVQGPVDAALRELLQANDLPFTVVGGGGARRLDNALAAVMPLWLAGLATTASPGR